MPQFRIFLGAPSRGEAFRTSMQSYQWQTVESKVQAPSVIFPPATLEAASRRISLIYQNIIFKDQDHQDPENSGDSDTSAWNPGAETTAITWPPSTEIITDVTENINRRLLASSSASDIDKSAQETEETISYNYSDASSIGRFPSFTFNLHSITSLSTLVSTKRSRKINVLVAALEVEGPDTITIKKGSDAGKQVSILKMILGDDLGNVAKLTAWRGVADSWGGNTASAAVKRGDIIYLQDVTASQASGASISITASPYLKSKLDICYRTMPYSHEDQRLRPDLRLSISDATVRKVAEVVKWFEGVAGLAAV